MKIVYSACFTRSYAFLFIYFTQVYTILS